MTMMGWRKNIQGDYIFFKFYVINGMIYYECTQCILRVLFPVRYDLFCFCAFLLHLNEYIISTVSTVVSLNSIGTNDIFIQIQIVSTVAKSETSRIKIQCQNRRAEDNNQQRHDLLSDKEELMHHILDSCNFCSSVQCYHSFWIETYLNCQGQLFVEF